MCPRMSTHVSVCLTPTVRQGHPSPGWLPRSALIQEMVKGTEAPPVKAPPLASSLPNASLSYFQVLSLLHPPGDESLLSCYWNWAPTSQAVPRLGPELGWAAGSPRGKGGPAEHSPPKAPQVTRNPGLSFLLSHVLSCHLKVWMRAQLATWPRTCIPDGLSLLFLSSGKG